MTIPNEPGTKRLVRQRWTAKIQRAAGFSPRGASVWESVTGDLKPRGASVWEGVTGDPKPRGASVWEGVTGDPKPRGLKPAALCVRSSQ